MSRPVVTIGADPEFFLGTPDGELKSAIDRIGGYKSAPRNLSRLGFAVQEDNVAVEFNVPPATSVEEWCSNIQWAMTEITNEVKGMGLQPVIQAAALFPEAELADDRAKAFGCDPDYNAWRGGLVNPRPHSPNARLRSCGGHVHIGYPLDTPLDKHRLIQLMDLYLGVPSILMDDDVDRRGLYGKAGAFRPTDYGVEYRVLSNFWLKKPEFTSWVFTQTNRAVDQALKYGKKTVLENVANGKRGDYYAFMETEDLCDEIQDCINYSSPILAQKLVAHHDLSVVT